MELSDLVADIESNRLIFISGMGIITGFIGGTFNLDGKIENADPIFTDPPGAYKRTCKRFKSHFHKSANCTCAKGSKILCVYCQNKKSLGYYEIQRNGGSKKMSPTRARVEKEISKAIIAGASGIPFANYSNGTDLSDTGEAIIYTLAARTGYEMGNRVYNFGGRWIDRFRGK